ncbi:uncharacterized protein EV420DRAFT_1533214 [Desarmillaria tabescens]|uniref:Uncharacterized protein n=1 Tax=Armillaria tabescens TaxID=1929756 RepID=A0AA39N7U2_ARMTA|nr:uncharacterized protein EV420DRAFT_1533214 [Desarmillaria tabescens]KAK0460628.1 hypothetical protein EV420DRAFT_1533214 [Desarmillaria tabescens]
MPDIQAIQHEPTSSPTNTCHPPREDRLMPQKPEWHKTAGTLRITGVLEALFTDAAYPRMHISFRKLVEDLSLGQKTVLRQESSAFLAVIPYGAGPKFYQTYTMLKQDVKAFIDNLQVEKGNYKISISKTD